jgi:CTP:molybdopterin cytidylyltransferase MocA
LANELDRLNFPPGNRVVNLTAESGMFSSVVCAANWNGWEPAISAWTIVLGDQPHLQNKTLQTLLAFHQAHPNSICQPSYGGHGRHPVLLPRGAWTELAWSKAHTLKDFLRETSTPLLECPIDDPHLELDLDTPEDYIKLRRLTQTDRRGHE